MPLSGLSGSPMHFWMHIRKQISAQQGNPLSVLSLCHDADTINSLITHRLTFSTILEEIPLKIRTNALLSSFIENLAEPSPSLKEASPETTPTSAIPPF